MDMDQAFLKKLLAAFTVEAHEHLEEIATGLRELKSANAEAAANWVEVIFRDMHSLKGAARAVNKSNIENLCQAAESLFAQFQKEQTRPTEKTISILYQTVDLIEADLENPDATSKEAVRQIILAIHHIQDGKSVSAPLAQPVPDKPPIAAPAAKEEEPAPLKPAFTKNDTVRVSQERLEEIMRESEELLGFKLSTDHRTAELRELSKQLAEWKKNWADIMPALRRLTQAAGQSDLSQNKNITTQVDHLRQQLEIIQDDLDPLDLRARLIFQNARSDAHAVSRFVDSLHDNMRELLMMPFSSSLSMLHKIVRDLTVEQNKQADLKIIGGDVEADRRILEGMKDPLIHLIRNSIDHGIESPKERTAQNKPEQGTVSISIAQIDSGKVHITIEDDGRGLNLAGIRKKLVEQKLASQEEANALSDDQLANSIFLSGFSTSDQVTAISGRGMGMSVVRERVESFGGSVSVSARTPYGTRISMVLPVGLATFRGILVRSGDRQFILPTPSVERMIRVPLDSIKTVESRETVLIDDQTLPLEMLSALLDLPVSPRSREKGHLHALIIRAGSQRFALEVDDVLREQEVLVKGLGPQLVRVRNISGIAVLGTGELAPILNVHDLVKSSILGGARPAMAPSAPVAAPAGRRKSIMIAEDSITSRMLLKNVLESAGYRVETAVDGAAAFASLKTGDFAALVSDVDMPRMNGFVLTERVRADRKLANLPVVLVTSLASQEDKERGIDAGASAYIVKSSFDQSNLVSVLGRLLETE